MSDRFVPRGESKWLIRIPQVFEAYEEDVLSELGATRLKRLGRDYQLIQCEVGLDQRDLVGLKFVPWRLPVHHMWPCKPLDTEGFVEKAAQFLAKKFGGMEIQTLMVGALDSDVTSRKFRLLASNLRGRALQLLPPAWGQIRDAEEQDSRCQTLFVFVGEEGLFAGVSRPVEANGFYPGGTRFIRQNGEGTISRAGAKIASALHQLKLYGAIPEGGGHWLEFGASPGGMTSELLSRGYRVTAVDRAPLDVRLTQSGGSYGQDRLRVYVGDASVFEPRRGELFDAILSDMNGDAVLAMRIVSQQLRHLREQGMVIFTLKMPGAETYEAIQRLSEEVLAVARAGCLELLAFTHLSYNRHEFTLMFRHQPRG